jgi:hypothetical protein
VRHQAIRELLRSGSGVVLVAIILAAIAVPFLAIGGVATVVGWGVVTLSVLVGVLMVIGAIGV